MRLEEENARRERDNEEKLRFEENIRLYEEARRNLIGDHGESRCGDENFARYLGARQDVVSKGTRPSPHPNNPVYTK